MVLKPCRECGEPVGDLTARFCPHCGATNPADRHFVAGTRLMVGGCLMFFLLGLAGLWLSC